MKKFCAVLLFGAILLGLFGCAASTPKQPLPHTEAATTEPTPIQQASVPVPYSVQYIRTNGGHDLAQYPQVQIIDSPQSLQDYYTANCQIYDLERKEHYADTTIGFLDACDRYDDAFFREHFLVFIVLEEGSGSVRHELQSVEQTPEQRLSISLDSVLPGGCGTADMAQWHVILELSSAFVVTSPEDVLVYWNQRLAFDGHALPIQTELPLKMPPDLILSTPSGDFVPILGGYNWFYDAGDTLMEAVVADQSARPVDSAKHHPITVDSEYAELVYLPDSESNTCSPMNFMGYLMKLNWEIAPTSVTYTCWPDLIWQDSSIPEYAVNSRQEQTFYAKPGGYVYEIVATWADTGVGYHGTANYYVYIMAEIE